MKIKWLEKRKEEKRKEMELAKERCCCSQCDCSYGNNCYLIIKIWIRNDAKSKGFCKDVYDIHDFKWKAVNNEKNDCPFWRVPVSSDFSSVAYSQKKTYMTPNQYMKLIDESNRQKAYQIMHPHENPPQDAMVKYLMGKNWEEDE